MKRRRLKGCGNLVKASVEYHWLLESDSRGVQADGGTGRENEASISSKRRLRQAKTEALLL